MCSENRVSVIVPVYNTAPWLRRCLDSIINQTYRNLEILCVNDGSTDNSAEILAEYAAKDARIKVFTQENAGLSAARNTALLHTTGEWIAGVDSDDYVAADVFEKAVACITEGVDAVFFGVQTVDDMDAEIPDPMGYFSLPTGEMLFSESLALQLNVCFWSKLWRRSFIAEHGLRFPDGLVHEDEAFYYLAAPWLRKVAFSPQIGYYYVQRAGSIMHSSGSILSMARKYVQVGEYVRAHAQAEHSSYYLSMMWRLYKQCFHFAARAERRELAETFRSALPEDAPTDDYRVACMKLEATRWVRPEPWRLVYCVFGVPVLARRFDGLRFTSWQFALWQVLQTHLSWLPRRK